MRKRFPKHEKLLRDPSVVKELTRSVAGPNATDLSENHWKTVERLLGMEVPTAYLRARSVPLERAERERTERTERSESMPLSFREGDNIIFKG